jgi:misacylated tRNA(Ala) deacylase
MTRELYLTNSCETSGEVNITKIEGEKVILDETLFYPTGGGQEHDTGTISQGGRAFEAYKVKKEGGEIIHYVKHDNELKPGNVQISIDWERRYRLMRHHSLLHVLAAVLYNKYGALCTGNQIHENKARIDFTGIKELSDEDWKNVVDQTNSEIEKGHPVSARMLPREEAENLSGTIKTVVNLIPKSVKDIRLVKIGDIDQQACGGTHVKDTNEIGEMVIEKIKNKGKGVTRLEVRAV